MKKRILALLVACMMVVAVFAGCSSEGNADANNDGGNTEQGGNEAVSDSDVIVLGGLAPLTGDVSVYGIAVNNGVQIAVDEVNAAGGIDGKEVKYVVYDERGDAAEAVNAYNRLVQNDGAVAIVGDVTTNPCMAVFQQSQNDGIPIITASGTGDVLTTYGDNLFRACFMDSFQGGLMASYAYERLGARSAAVLFDNSDDYSVGLKDAFVAQAAEDGLEVVAVESFTDGDVDFRAQLTNIAANDIDILYLPIYYENLALIAPQAREVGITATIVGGDGYDGVLSVIEESNLSSLEGCFYSCHAYIDENSEGGLADFVKKYEDLYGETPNMFAALGYDAAMLMMNAIDAADSTDSQALIDAMYARDYDGIPGHITFDEDGNPIKNVYVMTITDGAYTFVETYE